MLKINFKTTAIAETKDFAKFELSPLEQGYGLTLGNALRRVLLTSLPGAAITRVSIAGITHQFTSLQGVKEDIVELLLNLKQVRISYSGDKPVNASLTATGPGKVMASDIKTPANVTIVNKGLVLASLADKKSKLNVKLEISPGYGYLPAKDRQPKKLGEIILDATFSPVIRVNYQVETARVGRRTDLDKLILEIYTDGSLKPSQALDKAAQVLIRSFDQIINPVFEKEAAKPAEDTEANEAFELSVEELNLPTRIANALRKGGYSTVKDLAQATRQDIAKVKNLGSKSIDIIVAALKEKDIEIK
jgi:DNA-directed RNA polymerase subunit alpha